MSAACRATRRCPSLLVRREEGEEIDRRELAHEMDRAVRHVVEKQAEAGIDIGNDGEQQRVGFQTYVPQRMSGFGGESKRRRGRDYEEFPELVEVLKRRFPNRSRMQNAPEAQAELHYLDTSAIAREIERLQAQREGGGRVPGMLHDRALAGDHLDHHAERVLRLAGGYLNALAREMRKEYLAIHQAGLLLQIDSPDLAMDRSMFYRDLSDAEFVKAAEMHVAAINRGIEGIPRDRVRLHCCWGNWDGPHIHDVPLERDSAGAVPGERRRAQHRVRQSAAPARI